MGGSTSFSEARSLVCPFFMPRNHADPKESPTADPGKVANIDVSASDRGCEGDWDLADWREGLDLNSRASIRGRYGRLVRFTRSGQSPILPQLQNYCHW